MHELDIRLTPAEAVVLLEFLNRFAETDTLSIADRAEQWALWNLLCALERVILPPPSHPTLDEARAALRDPNE